MFWDTAVINTSSPEKASNFDHERRQFPLVSERLGLAALFLWEEVGSQFWLALVGVLWLAELYLLYWRTFLLLVTISLDWQFLCSDILVFTISAFLGTLIFLRFFLKWNRKNAKFFCVFFCSICRLGYFSVICFDGTMNFSNPEFLHKIVFVWHVFCKVFEEKRGFVFLEKVIIVRGFLPYFFTIFFFKKKGRENFAYFC